MFGSVFKMKAASGKKQALIDQIMRDERMPDGGRSFFLFDTGGDEVWGVAVFDDERSYRANSESPQQNKEYEAMRALLASDPEWHDGTVLPSPMNR